MEVMQHLRAEVEKKKEVLHHFKEDLEEVVEEALSKHRRSTTSRTTSDGSTITTVSSTSSSESNGTSSAGDISVDLDASKIEGQCFDEQAGDDDKDEKSVYFDKTEEIHVKKMSFYGQSHNTRDVK